MYTIIPLLLAHIQELNKQIFFFFLFEFIVKNTLLDLGKSKDDSLFSPKMIETANTNKRNYPIFELYNLYILISCF